MSIHNSAAFNLYKTPDLNGDFLVQPLKSYNSFFATKMNQDNSKSWKLANIISGIVAYPLFGLLAGLGMVIKSSDLLSIKAHNRAEKQNIHQLVHSNKLAAACSAEIGTSFSGQSIRMQTQEKVSIDATNTPNFAEVDSKIDLLSSKFRKVYPSFSCNFDIGSPKIMTVALRTIESTESPKE